MNINRIAAIAASVVAAATICIAGCTVNYTFSGASIPVDARTVSIAHFPNNATMVAPILSTTLTEALQDRFSRQTRLDIVREGGDLSFDGEIVNYMTAPASVSSNEYALQNRLTITVRVTFVNEYEPQYNFTNRAFTNFLDYDATQNLTEVEGTLIPQIVEMLVEDIFNAAVSNW